MITIARSCDQFCGSGEPCATRDSLLPTLLFNVMLPYELVKLTVKSVDRADDEFLSSFSAQQHVDGDTVVPGYNVKFFDTVFNLAEESTTHRDSSCSETCVNDDSGMTTSPFPMKTDVHNESWCFTCSSSWLCETDSHTDRP